MTELRAVSARLASRVFLALLLATPARAVLAEEVPAGWGQQGAIQQEIQQGKPLVIYVVVPLCHRDQIDCGEGRAGAPGDLERNLYWGAIFGARRFLDRPGGAWTRLGVSKGDEVTPERVVLRRYVDGKAWGLSGKKVEQILVLQAFHGDAIDRAVDHFFEVATAGGKVTIPGDSPREAAIHAVIYAGHNRMMDGKKLPAAREGAQGIASVVLACKSEPYFGPSLRAAGSRVLLTTRDLMAPEGYLIDAVARALGTNATAQGVREAAIESGRRWWKLTTPQVRWIFQPPS